MAKNERARIEKLVKESNEDISLAFNLDEHCSIGFNIDDGYITVEFIDEAHMYTFVKWLTEYAHIAPE